MHMQIPMYAASLIESFRYWSPRHPLYVYDCRPSGHVPQFVQQEPTTTPQPVPSGAKPVSESVAGPWNDHYLLYCPPGVAAWPTPPARVSTWTKNKIEMKSKRNRLPDHPISVVWLVSRVASSVDLRSIAETASTIRDIIRPIEVFANEYTRGNCNICYQELQFVFGTNTYRRVLLVLPTLSCMRGCRTQRLFRHGTHWDRGQLPKSSRPTRTCSTAKVCAQITKKQRIT